MLSSPRRPSSTMRIFSSAENFRRVMRRMSFTIFSAGSFTGTDFCLVLLGTGSLLYGSRRPALQICRAAAGDGSVLAWSPWTVDECDCPRLFFRPERIHGLRARMTRQGREKSYATHNRH